jgi:hypothetical protein
MLHPCVEDGKNFATFDGGPIRTCFDFRQNGFEFRSPQAKCLVPGDFLSVFSRR